MTVVPHQSSEIEVATLLRLRVPGLPDIRLQNYCADDFFYCSEPYSFCDFEIGGVSRQLDLSNSGVTLIVGNRNEAYDGLLPIRQLLRNHDGWRRAKAVITTLFPAQPDYNPIVNRLQILGSGISGATIELRLKSPIEAVNAQIPTSFITKIHVPELPQFASSNRF